MAHHWQITVSLMGQPAKQPVGTGDHSIASHCFIQLPSPSPEDLGQIVLMFYCANTSIIHKRAIYNVSKKLSVHMLLCFCSVRLLSYMGNSIHDLHLLRIVKKTKIDYLTQVFPPPALCISQWIMSYFITPLSILSLDALFLSSSFWFYPQTFFLKASSLN